MEILNTRRFHIYLFYFRVFKRFREVRPDLVPKQMKKNEPVNVRIPLEDSVEKIPELNVSLFLLSIDE